ncbi:hypothetical protein DPMN_076762 [Dreissena polymorpha]|uniref:Uncharacterized protein n=1 Tax=Dreissena polymorpha TaxID=45954 RepID=A0A9D3YKP6_DREPO|nr:hypothetical protein DPMN_076762 [Dreissena polymorpha]
MSNNTAMSSSFNNLSDSSWKLLIRIRASNVGCPKVQSSVAMLFISKKPLSITAVHSGMNGDKTQTHPDNMPSSSCHWQALGIQPAGCRDRSA